MNSKNKLRKMHAVIQYFASIEFVRHWQSHSVFLDINNSAHTHFSECPMNQCAAMTDCLRFDFD
jgi:hypothetical protein